MWCVAELTPEYIEKMEDTLGIYEKPYDPGQPVVCLDEKPISLHDDVRPPIPAQPCKPAKQDNEYEQCGVANIWRRGTEDRPPLHHRRTQPLWRRVRAYSRARRGAVPGGQHDSITTPSISTGSIHFT